MRTVAILAILAACGACGVDSDPEAVSQALRAQGARLAAKASSVTNVTAVNFESPGGFEIYTEPTAFGRTLAPGTVQRTNDQSHSGGHSLELTGSWDGTTRRDAEAQVCAPVGANNFRGTFWIRYSRLDNWSFVATAGTPWLWHSAGWVSPWTGWTAPEDIYLDTQAWYWTRAAGTLFADGDVGQVQVNTWHKIQLEVDVAADTQKISVDGVLGETASLSSRLGTAQNPRCLRWGTASRVQPTNAPGPAQTIWIDDVTIETW